MTTATKFKPSTVPGEGPMPVIDIDLHAKDMARRQAEHDAKKDVLRQCIQPVVAAQYEIEKPVYEYTVQASWLGPGPEGPGEWGPFTRKVVAQNEADAWARWCDSIEHFPSRREATVDIQQGKKLTQREAIAAAAMGPTTVGLPKYDDPTTRSMKKK